MKLGQTLSGLLNASFGNAVEIIVGIAALLQGKHAPIRNRTSCEYWNRRAAHCSDFSKYFIMLVTVR